MTPPATTPVRVVMVEDDPAIAALHRDYFTGLPEFRLVGHASTIAEALSLLEQHSPDLVLLDVRLPDGTGFDLLRLLRRARPDAFDVLMTTAVSDRVHVQRAVHLGVVDYLVKPFTRVEFERRLRAYRETFLRRAEAADHRALSQQEVDALRGVGQRRTLPKGLAQPTLALVEQALGGGEPRTASDVAEEVGLSRVSARRYLEHLVAEGIALSRPRYGGPGRPSTEYALGAEVVDREQYDL